VADDTNPKKPFANTDEFYHKLGLFYFAWSRTDLVIDFAVWKASEPAPAEQVHEQIAPMKFARVFRRIRCVADWFALHRDAKFLNSQRLPGRVSAAALYGQVKPDYGLPDSFARSGGFGSEETSSCSLRPRQPAPPTPPSNCALADLALSRISPPRPRRGCFPRYSPPASQQ
jgi:hypothetical protein